MAVLGQICEQCVMGGSVAVSAGEKAIEVAFEAFYSVHGKVTYKADFITLSTALATSS